MCETVYKYDTEYIKLTSDAKEETKKKINNALYLFRDDNVYLTEFSKHRVDEIPYSENLNPTMFALACILAKDINDPKNFSSELKKYNNDIKTLMSALRIDSSNIRVIEAELVIYYLIIKNYV